MNAKRDQNRIPSLLGTSSIDGETPVSVKADPSTGAILIKGISGLVIESYDYLAPTFNSTSDVWVYKSGGSSGDIIATVTINYTDATKATISSVERT